MHDLDNAEIEQPLFDGLTPRSVMDTPTTNSDVDEYRRGGLTNQLFNSLHWFRSARNSPVALENSLPHANAVLARERAQRAKKGRGEEPHRRHATPEGMIAGGGRETRLSRHSSKPAQ